MSDWQRFFDGHAPVYMQNAFTQGTKAEVDFLAGELKLAAGSAILDVGCGTGRHAVELAQRGYAVTGIDLSAGMLAEAKRAAEAAGVEVEWIQADATSYRSDKQFDAAVCLCEGAFGLLNTAGEGMQHDLAILANVHAALKPGGRLVLTALNAFRAIRTFSQRDVESGRFDPLTLVETHPMEWDTPEGKQSVMVHEQWYLPQDLVGMFEYVGMAVEYVWGGTAGRWGRRPVELDEMELMIVARKPEAATE